MAKVSKNARVAQRAANAGSGRDHVKVIKSIKDPKTGKYTYKEVIIHKDKVKDFLPISDIDNSFWISKLKGFS